MNRSLSSTGSGSPVPTATQTVMDNQGYAMWAGTHGDVFIEHKGLKN